VPTPARLPGGPQLWEGNQCLRSIRLTQWTDQGIKNAKASPKRQQDAREMAKKFGVERKNIFMTMGAYDFGMTVEAPDDQAIAKYVIALCGFGNVRTTTLKAFTEAEYRAIVEAVS
jgi:uncharacterized protein with GYD domain